MRIALDVSAVPERPAGAGRYVSEISRRLPSQGIDTTLVTRRNDAERWTAWSPAARVVSPVPSARLARLVYEAVALGRASDVDLWHGPHYTMPRRSKLPIVVTICDLTFFTNPEWHEARKVPFFRQAIRYAAQHADTLISISHYTTQLLNEICQPSAPIITAPLGVDLERFSRNDQNDETLLRAAELPVGVGFILFVGTIEPRKGLDVLLHAFAELASEDSDLELWIVGQAGWGVDDNFAALPFASRIRRIGYVLDELLPALMRQARVVAYPSRGEGFGLPVLEALACGALVVTTANTVMEEVAGTVATLSKVGDTLGLATALRSELALDRVQREVRAESARRRSEIFTWDATMAGHVAAYELALSRGH